MNLIRLFVIISLFVTSVSSAIAAPTSSKKKTAKARPIPSQITSYICYKSSQHDQVRAVQMALTKAGYAPGPIDGIYGKQVQTAMQKLQSDLHLVADGCYMGRTSRNFLNAVLQGKSPKRLTSSRTAKTDSEPRCLAASINHNTVIRSTTYIAGEENSDKDTDAGRTSTGVQVRCATSEQIGTMAGDPELVRQGSLIEVTKVIKKRNVIFRYILVDTGGGVFSQTASGGTCPIFDFYGKCEHKGSIRVIPYTGATPYLQLTMSQKRELLKLKNWKSGKFRNPSRTVVTLALL